MKDKSKISGSSAATKFGVINTLKQLNGHLCCTEHEMVLIYYVGSLILVITSYRDVIQQPQLI